MTRETEASSVVSIQVKQEQKDALYFFFMHSDCEFEEVAIENQNDEKNYDRMVA